MKEDEEKNVRNRYAVIKRSTALIIAGICLVVGFLAGIFYSTAFPGSSKVRKITVKQPVSRTPDPVSPLPGVISALEREVAENPRDAEAWARLGHNYFDSNDAPNAIRAYKKSLELKPGNADVWTDLGIMYRRTGEPAEAIRCFDKAIESNPRHRQSRYNKGIVLMHDLENPQAAVKVWEELVNIYPDAATQDGTPLKKLIEKFSPSPSAKK